MGKVPAQMGTILIILLPDAEAAEAAGEVKQITPPEEPSGKAMPFGESKGIPASPEEAAGH